MRNMLMFYALLVVLVGSPAVANPFPANKAIINDVAVKAPADSGYRVTEVDGKPAERARSSFITVVPFVLLEPGEREIALEAKVGKDLPPVKVNVTVEAGKRYRLKKEGNAVVLIEDKK